MMRWPGPVAAPIEAGRPVPVSRVVTVVLVILTVSLAALTVVFAVR